MSTPSPTAWFDYMLFRQAIFVFLSNIANTDSVWHILILTPVEYKHIISTSTQRLTYLTKARLWFREQQHHSNGIDLKFDVESKRNVITLDSMWVECFLTNIVIRGRNEIENMFLLSNVATRANNFNLTMGLSFGF